MRLLLAAAVLLHSARAADVGMNQPCNKDLDGLLASDPNGSERTFLSCVGVGVGNIAFWERKICPNEMVFDFINQQCKAKRKKSRKQQTLNIAILNNSCANGETCIGGTVCDLDTLRCLCPFGTIPQVETLSCVKNDVSPAFNFNSFNFENSDFFKPNPGYQKTVTSYTPDQGYSGSSSSWQPYPQQPNNNFNGGGDFKPNQFVFNMFTTTMAPPTTPKVPVLAYPGQSCKDKEICSGGSICTLPIGLCLCPGELEARDGECVLPASAAIQITRVGIGALCSELAECDHGSSCVMGRCACVSPLIQHEGKCVLRQARKEVGPGELCDNGEVCGKGSVCDQMIPVCVCPTDTDLKDGECVRVAKPVSNKPAPIPTYPPPVRTVPPATRPPLTQAQYTQPPPTYLPPTLPAQPAQVYRPAPTAAPAPPPSTINYQTIVTPPRPTGKPNNMKINLGGSKQAGVGVRCALNTDCMIGAYCNGNTNPPSCQCLSTHVNIEGRCEKIVYPGQIGCRSDLQCSSAYTGTSCIDRVCVCPDGNKAVDQTCVPDCNPACSAPLVCLKSKCVQPKRRRARQLSSLICYPDSKSCSHGDGVCLSGECRCLRGWQPRDGACRPIEVPIGASCSGQETVCQPDAVCDSGICRCRYPGTCQQPEGSCTEDPDCQSGERCSNGKCICAAENCLSSMPAPVVYKNLNSACWGSDRCSGGSICKDSVCQCTDGASELHGRCQQQPGGRCSSGQTCSSGSVCDFGLCRCQDGFSLHNGACHMTASPPGKSCQLGQQCLHGSACRFGVCMCIGKTIALGGRCVKRQELAVKVAEVLPGTLKGPGQVCKTKDLCTGGSRCVDGYCECEDFETIIDDQCVGNRDQAVVAIENLQVAAPGQPCEARTNCTGGSLCIDRKCQCEQGAVTEDGGCSRTTPSASPPKKSGREPVLPGSLCTLTLECPFRTECTRGVCRCKKGETIVDGSCRTAIHQVFPGGKCDPRNGYDCVGESHCIYGVCTCVRQLINNGRLCVTATEITIIPIGKRCTVELICAGGSRCLNGYCRCREDEVGDVNGKCVKKSSVYPVFNRIVGSTTTSPEDRFKNKIDEIEELELEIKNNPLASLGESRPNAVTLEVIYGSPCSTNDDCPTNSFCQYSQCQCIPGFRATGGYCEKVLKAGEDCGSTNQCETNAFCLNGKCICSSRDGRTCSTPDLRRPGEECGEGRICAFNSYCGIMSGVCECPSGMSTQDSVCQQTAVKPGMACVTSRNCHKYSYCDNGYCLCKTGFNLVEGFCVPLTGGPDRFLPPDRNDGPQAPMQERIRTESYMKLNPAESGVTGSEQGTAYEFGAGRVQGFNPYGQNGYETRQDRGSQSAPGQVAQDRKSESGSVHDYESGRPEQGRERFNGQVGTPYENGPEKNGRQFNSYGQTMTVTHNSVRSEGTPYNFGPVRGQNYQQNPENYHEDIEDDFDPSPPSITQQPVKVVLPVGSTPDIFSAPGVQSPFVFQPYPFARGTNTKSGDQPAFATTFKPTTIAPKVRVAMPGEYCADGSICLGNSVCKGQFCRCPIGASAENGICTQRKRLHPLAMPQHNAVQEEEEEERVEQRQFSAPLENCQNFEYCTAGSECLNIHGMGLICQCAVGMIFLDEECVDTPKRAELAGIGDNCSQGEICLGGSSCLKGVCVCGDGKREILGICVLTAQPGDDCGRGETCVDGSICVGEFRTCVCPPGKASKLGRCVEDLDSLAMTTGAANPGENCDSHVVCMDNSFCDGKGHCACLPKFKNVKGRCVPASMVRLIGEPCPPGTICSGGACTIGICSCRDGQIEIEGACVEVPRKSRKSRSVCKPGEDCEANLPLNSDTECQEDCPEHASCQEGICICDDGYRREMDACVERHPHTDEHFPIWKQIFGKKTVNGDQEEEAWTHREFSSRKDISKIPWTDKLTVTTIPWVAKARATTPLPTEDQDLGAITLSERLPTVTRARVPFLRKKTTVDRPRKPNNKLPFVYVGPGASCVGKRKCSEGSICFDGNCVCGYQDQPINDECVPRDGMVRFGHRCSENHGCLQGLVCVFNRCQCPFGDQYCDPNEPVTSPPGGSCTEARECTGGSVCREGWCICPDPTMIVQKGICIQSGPRPTLPSRTVPVYTTPSPPVYHPTAPSPTPGRIFQALPSPQQAARKRTPGSQCGPLDTCVGGSACVESLCVCPAGMQPSMHGRCEFAPSSTPATVSSYQPRRPTAVEYIELPPAGGGPITVETTTLHAPHQIPSDNSECEAIGLFCRGNTICINRSCQCPEGHILHNDGCVPPTEMKRRKVRGKSRHQAVSSSQYARPGESCALGQVCTGGATCSEAQMCDCPMEKPVIKNEFCHAEVATRRQAVAGESCDANTDCVNSSFCHSGQCRCPPQYVAVSGHCIPMPMPTTPAMKVFSKPLESCDDGEICSGGSKCDEDTGICMCPSGQIAFGEQCKFPPTPAPATTTTTTTMRPTPSPFRVTPAQPTVECTTDSQCQSGRTCMAGKCRCRPGTVDHAGVCEPLEEIEAGERPIPISYARHRALSEPKVNSTERVSQPAMSPSERPRIVGPPIRRPKPKSKGSSGGTGAAGIGNNGSGNYKTGGSGAGNCPPGNEATRDDSGKLVICNGLEPNCPPRSYCYITSGGFATEEYNCFTRKLLKYGQPCDRYMDRCTNGAKCLDEVCKCAVGFALSPNGWCERFNFLPQSKQKTFSAIPSPTEPTKVEPALPARPAWNVHETPRPQWPSSIRPTPAYTPDYNQDTVAPAQETPAPLTFPPPAPPLSAPAPTQPPIQIFPSTVDGPRIRGRVAGSSCRSTDMCLHGSACVHGRCQCKSPLVARNGHCVKLNLADPGVSCSQGEQCTGGSICDNDSKMCICAVRHSIVDGVCKSKDSALFVPPGSSCSNGQVCSGGSTCVTGTCLCDSLHYPEDGYCRHINSQSSEIDHEVGGPLRFSSQLSPRAPATVCDPERCRLPDCFCSVTGRKPPLSAQIHDVPQFIVLTFDDAVNGRTLPDYLTLFSQPKYKNPNGCSVKATFFISHEWTNYDAVQWLAEQEMDIASNSISHVNMAGENASRWLNEMDGQRRILAKFANIPEESIVGMRAPQLAAGGDAQFEMMKRAGFLYDNTLSANPGIDGEPFWPQTLDFAVPWNCYEENCPTGSFPGLWEVPLNQFHGAYVRQIDSYRRSSMIRAAVDLNNTIEELTDMIMINFDRAYTSNKAPFVLSLNADFLQLNGKNEGMTALQRFLDEVTQNKDVFLVSMKQLIEWMQNPLPMTEIHKSDALRCDRQRFSSSPRESCQQANKCMYRTPTLNSYEHQFKTCAPCPDVFPWTHNPTGNIR